MGRIIYTFVLSCTCCALVLTEEQQHVFQYYSILYLIRYIFSFSCSYTIHTTRGSPHLEHVGPGKVLLVLHSFVCTGSRVDDTTIQKIEHVLFAQVFASIMVVVIVIDGFAFSVR